MTRTAGDVIQTVFFTFATFVFAAVGVRGLLGKPVRGHTTNIGWGGASTTFTGTGARLYGVFLLVVAVVFAVVALRTLF